MATWVARHSAPPTLKERHRTAWSAISIPREHEVIRFGIPVHDGKRFRAEARGGRGGARHGQRARHGGERAVDVLHFRAVGSVIVYFDVTHRDARGILR